MNVELLDNLFQEYGYEAKEKELSYRVYVLNQGMYHGAEVLALEDCDVNHIAFQYSKLGYHAKVQRFRTVDEVEDYLFSGFFNTQTTVNDIKKRYNDYAANQVKHYGDSIIKYQYINMPYSVYGEVSDESQEGTIGIVPAIMKELNKKGAHLIIVEAAAGFGKTCTAYEVYKSFIEINESKKPIFTELSSNRDAKQFKYILWSEIDKEKDTTAKQDLVVYNIKKGRIPLIIDGFDELLSKDIDSGKADQLNEFEQVETMLSTIGDLLTDESKVVLTSRKTAIFAGAEFESWVDSYEGNFDVIRFQLNKPDIKEWLPVERYNEINSREIPLNSLSNPVLLTYLRNVEDEEFDKLLLFPETITDNFFKFLLNREKERQNLNIRWEDQLKIFENLAMAMAEFDVTGESRAFVKELIKEYNKDDLMYFKESMTTKQTLDELADTLTNHALLDRMGNKDFITFVNEFVFGYLLGKGIIKDIDGFLHNLKSIPCFLFELAVESFKYLSEKDKDGLWDKLSIIKKKMSLSLSLAVDSVLKGRILNTYECEGINSYTFDRVVFRSSECSFVDVSFVDTTFTKCIFDVKAFTNVTFTGCRFVDCKLEGSDGCLSGRQIHCYGCEDYNTGFIASIKNEMVTSAEDTEVIRLELQILGKYFKVDGKSPKMRYISWIRKEFEDQDLDKVFASFYTLKKRGMLLVDGNNSHISKIGINYYHKNVQL